MSNKTNLLRKIMIVVVFVGVVLVSACSRSTPSPVTAFDVKELIIVQQCNLNDVAVISFAAVILYSNGETRTVNVRGTISDFGNGESGSGPGAQLPPNTLNAEMQTWGVDAEYKTSGTYWVSGEMTADFNSGPITRKFSLPLKVVI